METQKRIINTFALSDRTIAQQTSKATLWGVGDALYYEAVGNLSTDTEWHGATLRIIWLCAAHDQCIWENPDSIIHQKKGQLWPLKGGCMRVVIRGCALAEYA